MSAQPCYLSAGLYVYAPEAVTAGGGGRLHAASVLSRQRVAWAQSEQRVSTPKIARLVSVFFVIGIRPPVLALFRTVNGSVLSRQ
eukprot:9105607-Pyramimonas_sp.AAC.1